MSGRMRMENCRARLQGGVERLCGEVGGRVVK